MTAGKDEHSVAQEANRLNREHSLERQAAEGRIQDVSLGHYEKLAVLQAGIFALSVTFLAGLSSQATTHHVSILHLRFLLTCWFAMPCSILLCVLHNWLSTKSFVAINEAWGWGSKKLLLKHMASVPNTDRSSTLEAMLYDSGIMDEWQGESARRSSWLYRLATYLEYAVHVTFLIGLICLGAFVITNVKAFLP
jgi:hypothetical protein